MAKGVILRQCELVLEIILFCFVNNVVLENCCHPPPPPQTPAVFGWRGHLQQILPCFFVVVFCVCLLACFFTTYSLALTQLIIEY